MDAGTVRLVGTHVEKIVSNTQALLNDEILYKRMSQAQNPYGDGNAAARIVGIISQLASRSVASLSYTDMLANIEMLQNKMMVD